MGIFRISVFAMVFLPLLFVNLVTQPYLGHYDTAWRKLRKQTGRETEALHDPRQKADKAVAPSEVHIPAITGGSFLMDAYEYPNLKHSMPKTGIEPSEAMGICEILGKHLCTIDEWFQACSEDGEYRYMPTPVPFSLEEDVAAGTWPLGMKKLRKACNVNSVELARSGEFPQCRGHRPVYDLVGNIFEWVHIPDSGGFWALMGSYYKYDDKWTTSCLFQTLVHEGQLSMIDLPSTGFRCCRLGETGTD
jgi:formylglycine-generating enzyme required for sulfatase activity